MKRLGDSGVTTWVAWSPSPPECVRDESGVTCHRSFGLIHCRACDAWLKAPLMRELHVLRLESGEAEAEGRSLVERFGPPNEAGAVLLDEPVSRVPLIGVRDD